MKANPKIFKANDIRGKYPGELNEEVVLEICAALKKFFPKKAKLVIGYDARLSSPSLYKALIKGLDGGQAVLVKAGFMTTPMLYFLVNELRASGGVMVTASHNPKEFNGLKVVKKGARPVSGEEIKKIVMEK